MKIIRLLLLLLITASIFGCASVARRATESDDGLSNFMQLPAEERLKNLDQLVEIIKNGDTWDEEIRAAQAIATIGPKAVSAIPTILNKFQFIYNKWNSRSEDDVEKNRERMMRQLVITLGAITPAEKTLDENDLSILRKFIYEKYAPYFIVGWQRCKKNPEMSNIFRKLSDREANFGGKLEGIFQDYEVSHGYDRFDVKVWKRCEKDKEMLNAYIFLDAENIRTEETKVDQRLAANIKEDKLHELDDKKVANRIVGLRTTAPSHLLAVAEKLRVKMIIFQSRQKELKAYAYYHPEDQAGIGSKSDALVKCVKSDLQPAANDFTAAIIDYNNAFDTDADKHTGGAAIGFLRRNGYGSLLNSEYGNSFDVNSFVQ